MYDTVCIYVFLVHYSRVERTDDKHTNIEHQQKKYNKKHRQLENNPFGNYITIGQQKTKTQSPLVVGTLVQRNL